MADAALKSIIKQSLEDTYFSGCDDAVWVLDSDEPGDNIHVVIVSPKFHGKRLKEKADLIHSVLLNELPPDD